MIEFFGTGIFSFGFLFFLAVFLDKSLSGKISATIAHYYHRGKAENAVDNDFFMRDLKNSIREIIREEISAIFIQHLDERDKKNK